MKDVTRWDLNKVGEMLLAKIISSHCTQGDFFQQKGDFVPCMMLVVDGVSVNFLSDRILSVRHVLDHSVPLVHVSPKVQKVTRNRKNDKIP